MSCFRTVFLQFRRNADCMLRCPFFHDVKTSGCAGKVTQYVNYPSIANRGPWSSLIIWVGDAATPAVPSGSSSLAGGKQVDKETTEHSCADRPLCQEDNTAGAAPGQPRGQGRRLVSAEARGGQTAGRLRGGKAPQPTEQVPAIFIPQTGRDKRGHRTTVGRTEASQGGSSN